MSEDFDLSTTDEQPRPIRARGILIAMSFIVIAMAIAGAVYGGRQFAFGVIFGGVLSFVNFDWLDRSTKAIFRENATTSAAVLALKYILRYAALGTVIWLVHITEAFPVAAVILGLGAFAFAVVVQGLKNIFTSTF